MYKLRSNVLSLFIDILTRQRIEFANTHQNFGNLIKTIGFHSCAQRSAVLFVVSRNGNAQKTEKLSHFNGVKVVASSTLVSAVITNASGNTLSTSALFVLTRCRTRARAAHLGSSAGLAFVWPMSLMGWCTTTIRHISKKKVIILHFDQDINWKNMVFVLFLKT